MSEEILWQDIEELLQNNIVNEFIVHNFNLKTAFLFRRQSNLFKQKCTESTRISESSTENIRPTSYKAIVFSQNY